ncbi:MAG: hypothetical protein EB168_08910 [Euryarchaeota archaeon]|nr:hypothetical protein [Euryarchaeota archaeon]
MLLNDKAMTRLAENLAFELQDMRSEDVTNPYAEGVWAGISYLLRAQAEVANQIEGVEVNPYQVRRVIEAETKKAFASLFPEDYYPERD